MPVVVSPTSSLLAAESTTVNAVALFVMGLRTTPPVPAWTVTVVAPVVLPTVRFWATASVLMAVLFRTPVTVVVAPFRVLAPLPVLKVPAPFWVKLLFAEMVTLPLRLTAPVPVVNALAPVTVVGPFSETAPVPVPKVPNPFWRKLLLAATVTAPFNVTAPVPVEKVFAPVTDVGPLSETAPEPVEKVPKPNWLKAMERPATPMVTEPPFAVANVVAPEEVRVVKLPAPPPAAPTQFFHTPPSKHRKAPTLLL